MVQYIGPAGAIGRMLEHCQLTRSNMVLGRQVTQLNERGDGIHHGIEFTCLRKSDIRSMELQVWYLPEQLEAEAASVPPVWERPEKTPWSLPSGLVLAWDEQNEI